MEIKPCPFCGSKGKATRLGDKYWIVVCDGTNCPVQPVTKLAKTKQKAIEAWNTRSEK